MRTIKSYFAVASKDNFNDDTVFKGASKRVVLHGEEQDYRSYIESNIEISVLVNGSLVLHDSDTGELLYFNSDQLIHLQKALNVAIDIAMKQDINKIFSEEINQQE